MLIPDNLKSVTKNGLELDFEITLDVTHSSPKWVYHNIQAFMNIDGEKKEVGYIRLAFVDQKKKEEFFDNILYYHVNYRSHKTLRTGIKSVYELTENELDSIVNLSGSYEDKLNYLNVKLKMEMPDYERFMRYHYNKPEPDMIQVDENFRKKGIGIELYKKAIEFCNLNGLNFYQSTTQTSEAVGAWKHIEKNIDNIGSYVFKGSKNDIVRKFIGKYEPALEFKNGLEKKKKNKNKPL